MRLPTRLHITWADADTLKLETDAGQQTRLFHFIASSPQVGEVTWQGDSAAMWVKQAQQKGFGRLYDGPAPRKSGALRSSLLTCVPAICGRMAFLSANAVLIEYFDRVELDGVS
jgi:hypothetical protein